MARRGASRSVSGIGLICSLWDLANFWVTLQTRWPHGKRCIQDNIYLTFELLWKMYHLSDKQMIKDLDLSFVSLKIPNISRTFWIKHLRQLKFHYFLLDLCVKERSLTLPVWPPQNARRSPSGHAITPFVRNSSRGVPPITCFAKASCIASNTYTYKHILKRIVVTLARIQTWVGVTLLEFWKKSDENLVMRMIVIKETR